MNLTNGCAKFVELGIVVIAILFCYSGARSDHIWMRGWSYG